MDLVEAVVQVHFKLKVLILNLVNLFFFNRFGFPHILSQDFRFGTFCSPSNFSVFLEITSCVNISNSGVRDTEAMSYQTYYGQRSSSQIVQAAQCKKPYDLLQNPVLGCDSIIAAWP